MPDTAPFSPRWTLTIEPTADGQVSCSYAGHAEGVTGAELAHYLARLVVTFSGVPGRVMQTEAQVMALAARAQLLKDNPATTIYVRDGFSVYVGPLPEEQIGRLKAAGWVNGGAVPKGCAEPCLFVTEPEAFEAISGPAAEANESAAPPIKVSTVSD